LNSYGINLRFNQKRKINVPWDNPYHHNQYNLNEYHRLYEYQTEAFINLDYNEFHIDPKTILFYIDPPYLNSKFEYNLSSDWRDFEIYIKSLKYRWISSTSSPLFNI
jgi:site-specific DNA-adenine methylase